MNKNETCCPTSGRFCWRNPVHVVLFLAILPFALDGLNTLWSAVRTALDAVVK